MEKLIRTVIKLYTIEYDRKSLFQRSDNSSRSIYKINNYLSKKSDL